MKKLLILIVSVALFLHFYPQPELKKWYTDQKKWVVTTFTDITDTQVRLKTEKVFNDLKPEFKHFSPEEIEYITQLTSDRKALIAFYFAHCDVHEPDFNFQSANQIKVCSAIQQYRNYF